MEPSYDLDGGVKSSRHLRKRLAELLPSVASLGDSERSKHAWELACTALDESAGDDANAVAAEIERSPLVHLIAWSAPPASEDAPPLSAEALDDCVSKVVTPENAVRMGEALLASAAGLESEQATEIRNLLHGLLEHGHRRSLLARMEDHGLGARWFEVVAAAIERTDYTLRDLLRRRAARYPDQVLFRVLTQRGERCWSFASVLAETEMLGGALWSYKERYGATGPVAILSHNRIEMALLDLACLTGGITNIMIPTTTSPGHVRKILEHSEAGLLVASTIELARGAFLPAERAEHLKRYILFEPSEEMRGSEVQHLAEMLQRHPPTDSDRRRYHEAGQAVAARDLATVMYTSGTTGQPKGIPFNHLNIVSKRFARALALPAIGPGDRFLNYLPLCHTFGRWLEMTGAIFWGAEYTFLGRPTKDALLAGMRRVRPKVFISVPSKWNELYEQIASVVDPEQAPPDEVRRALTETTGGELAWGLSAAGRLEPEIFRFFARNGVNLLSGYGMTEATGGVSMTRPGHYIPESVGVPLPGIETRLAPDGELELRGPYVVESYHRSDPADASFNDGWLKTGDLFDGSPEHGFFFRDRKKDVYKNSKGQTIAPSLIENHLEDFEEVRACFVVGDGRPYNTALIYPYQEPAAEIPVEGQGSSPVVDFDGWSARRKRDHFESIIVAVNRFLHPFERVVKFALIERDFTLERGERTEKGSLRRKAIEENFKETIESLYGREYIVRRPKSSEAASRPEVQLPIWLLRELGITASAVRAVEGQIRLQGLRRKLPVAADPDREGCFFIGSLSYRLPTPVVSLDLFMRTPRLWIGNTDLVDFSGEEVFEWSLRPKSGAGAISVVGWRRPSEQLKDLPARLEDAQVREEFSLESVHLAAAALQDESVELVHQAVRFLGIVLRQSLGRAELLARDWLLFMARHPAPEIRRHAFQSLSEVREKRGFRDVVLAFFEHLDEVLDEAMSDRLCRVGVGSDELESLLSLMAELRAEQSPLIERTAPLQALFRFLVSYGATHAESFLAIRGELASFAMRERDPLETAAYRAVVDLVQKFQAGLPRFEHRACQSPSEETHDAGLVASGPPSPSSGRAPDGGEWGLLHADRGTESPEQGSGWDQVIVFEEGLDPGDRARILMALETTTLLPEALTLLCGAPWSESMEHLAPGSIWVTFSDLRYGRTHYRVAVRTRSRRSYEFSLALFSSHLHETVETELLWRMRLSSGPDGLALLPEIGGLYRKFAMFSVAVRGGETVLDLLQRLLGSGDPKLVAHVRGVWPHLIWSAAEAYIRLWERMDRQWGIVGPSPAKVVVPPHDYLTGTRLVSMSGRRKVRSLATLMMRLVRGFLGFLHFRFPDLASEEDAELLLCAVLEVLGSEEGLRAIREVADEYPEGWGPLVRRFEERVAREGFWPKALVFAVRRFERWSASTEGATREARATMLREIWNVYGLDRLRAHYPGLRMCFFRRTVFAEAEMTLGRELDRLIATQVRERLKTQDLLGRITALRDEAVVGTEEEFFLARMAYPYLADTQPAELVPLQEGDRLHTDIEVTRNDGSGRPLRIRRAANPKEVGRLQRMFVEADMAMPFLPEHRHLVVLDERDYIIGGLTYREEENEADVVRIDRYAVTPHRRKRGVARELLEEFCARMAGRGVRSVTVAYLQPRYHASVGFEVDHLHGGMIRHLPPVEGGKPDPNLPPFKEGPFKEGGTSPRG